MMFEFLQEVSHHQIRDADLSVRVRHPPLGVFEAQLYPARDRCVLAGARRRVLSLSLGNQLALLEGTVGEK